MADEKDLQVAVATVSDLTDLASLADEFRRHLGQDDLGVGLVPEHRPDSMSRATRMEMRSVTSSVESGIPRGPRAGMRRSRTCSSPPRPAGKGLGAASCSLHSPISAPSSIDSSASTPTSETLRRSSYTTASAFAQSGPHGRVAASSGSRSA